MVIRRVPDDFLVTEVLGDGALRTDESAAALPFAVYALKKESLTTPEACGRLARALNVKPGSVEPAGLKDKHAVTIQHVSVRTSNAPPEVGGERWAARLVGHAPSEARSEWIERNEFEIVVRSLSGRECTAMEDRADFLHDPEARGSLAIANYFGDQRFGSARHGAGFLAPSLVRGDFEGALRLAIGTPARKETGAKRTLTRAMTTHWGDWKKALAETAPCPERVPLEALARGCSFKDAFAALPAFTQQMSVEAYQSFVWNETIATLIKEAGAAKFAVEGEHGEFILPRAGAIDPHMRLRLPGPDWSGSADARRAMESVLARDELTMEGLRVPGLRRPAFGSPERDVMMRAADLWMSRPAKDEHAPARSTKPYKRLLRFSLPRGSYATVVVAALAMEASGSLPWPPCGPLHS